MAGQVNKRKDKDRIVLRKGESQRKDGNYDYRWTTRDGKRHSVYAKTLEELRAKPECRNLLNEIDILVDGRFIIARKTLTMRFRGSSNQRLYHLKHGEVISVE